MVVLLVFASGVYFAFPALVGSAAAVLFVGLALLFLCGLCFPSRFRKGVQAVAGGFEVWRPLRTTALVKYEEIETIVAIARGEGATDDELTFQVRTQAAKLSVHEYDVYSTGVFIEMARLPGFNHAAFECASRHSASLRDWLLGKRFPIYSKAGGRDA